LRNPSIPHVQWKDLRRRKLLSPLGRLDTGMKPPTPRSSMERKASHSPQKYGTMRYVATHVYEEIEKSTIIGENGG